jgi:hypothetical protein
MAISSITLLQKTLCVVKVKGPLFNLLPVDENLLFVE